MIHRLRIDLAGVEEIARNEHEIYPVGDSVVDDDIMPGTEKIFRTLFQIVAAAAQVYICDVKKFHILFLNDLPH